MRGLGWMIRKELALVLADRQGALLTVVMPVLLAALVGMLFSPSGDAGHLTLPVAAGDAEATERFVEKLAAQDGVTVVRVDATEARRRVSAGEASVALVLSDEAAGCLGVEGMFGGCRVEAPLLRDPSRPYATGFAAGRIQRALFESLAEEITDRARLRPALRALRLASARDAVNAPLTRLLDASLEFFDSDAGEATEGTLDLPLKLVVEDVAGSGGPSDYNSYAHTFAGMLCMFLLFGAMTSSKGLIAERDQGTLTRLRVAPVSRATVLLGVAGGAAIVALVTSALVYAVGLFVFGIEVRGSVIGFVAVLGAQALFVGGFALLMAGLADTARQVDGLGSFAVLVMSFMGGAWLPSFLMPEWLSKLALALPTRWATDGLAAMTWRGLDLSAGLVPAGVLLGFGLVCGVVGARTFSWR